jgi:hypothetical protein
MTQNEKSKLMDIRDALFELMTRIKGDTTKLHKALDTIDEVLK